MYNGSIQKISILSKTSLDFVTNILVYLKSEFKHKNEVIYNIDDLPEKSILFFLIVYFIVEGVIFFYTSDDIAINCLKHGSYFGEIELLKKIHRELLSKTIENCFLLTMKKEILNMENFLKHHEFFKLIIKNKNIREEFYEKVKRFINKIIEEGKYVCTFNTLILKELRKNSQINNQLGINKIYFCVGLFYYKNEINKDKKDKTSCIVEVLDRFTIYKDNKQLMKKFQNMEKDNKVFYSFI